MGRIQASKFLPDNQQDSPINDSFSYRIKRSTRAKRARLVVSVDKVEVVVPLRMVDFDVHGFVSRHRDWVEQTRHKLRMNLRAIPPLLPERFCRGEEILFQGRRWPLEVRTSASKRPRVAFCDGFSLTVPEAVASEVCDSLLRDAVCSWLKQRLLEEAHNMVGIHGGVHQLVPRSIRLREQKTRWGSCGIHNDIQLNWRLIFAPPSVLEYVVVHELCHIRHRDHSTCFWGLVSEHLPNYLGERAWLREHGAGLLRPL